MLTLTLTLILSLALIFADKCLTFVRAVDEVRESDDERWHRSLAANHSTSAFDGTTSKLLPSLDAGNPRSLSFHCRLAPRSPDHRTLGIDNLNQTPPMTMTGDHSFRLRSHRHEYESGFPFTARRSFTRTSGAFTVTCTSTQLNACRPYWIKSNRGNASRINNHILLQSYYFYKTAVHINTSTSPALYGFPYTSSGKHEFACISMAADVRQVRSHIRYSAFNIRKNCTH